jgi:hypothetical protein
MLGYDGKVAGMTILLTSYIKVKQQFYQQTQELASVFINLN